MNDPVNTSLRALPDGEAELRLVVRLGWEDVASLGQEASRLAAQMKRPVSLDEAASHRLRTRAAGHAKPAQDWPVAAPASTVSSLTARTGEHARQAIEKINGAAGDPAAAQRTAPPAVQAAVPGSVPPQAQTSA
ncbi:hypothetical protein ACFXKG_13680 [Streptomyces sp. NPDC059255]|uniref:hypothetical protein n=1 Tax=Streptomyces sp. NPDC059255 TaxID=3346793 RepID=UPI0036A0DA03